MASRFRDMSPEEKRKYKAWVKKIRDRDSNMCIMCKDSERLNAHHIETWQHNPLLRYDINNGVLLCYQCHKETFKREQEYEFIFKNYITSVKYKSGTALPDYSEYLKMKYGEKDEQEKETPSV